MKRKSRQELEREIQELRDRLEIAEETLRAIQEGEVDALVVSGSEGERVFTLQSPDYPYRLFVEQMTEGAATLTSEGMLLYSNSRLASLVKTPLEQLIGSKFQRFLDPSCQPMFQALLQSAHTGGGKGELRLIASDGTKIPVQVSINSLTMNEVTVSCLVVTDLTEQKRNEAIVSAEKLARSILEQVAEAVIVCDEAGKIIRTSLVANQICGENPIFKPFDRVFPLQFSNCQSQSLHDPPSPPYQGGNQNQKLASPYQGGNQNEKLASPYQGGNQNQKLASPNPEENQNQKLASPLTKGGLRGVNAEQPMNNEPSTTNRFSIATVLDGESFQKVEASFQRKDGQKFDLLVSACSLLAPESTIEGCVVTLTDITLRKQAELELQRSNAELEVRVAERTAQLQQANNHLMRELQERQKTEEALRMSQARFAGILEIASDAIISVDVNQRITLFNQGAEKIFGYTAAEVLGQPLDLLIPDRFSIAHRQHVSHFGNSDGKARRMGARGEIFGCRKDGTEFLAEASISKLEVAGEIAFTVFLHDITDRKRAEEAASRLAAIVESSEDAIISQSLDGIILSWNAGAEKLLGYTPQEAIGRAISMLVPPERLDEMQQTLQKIRQGERVEHYETIRVRQDGQRIYISTTVSPIKDKNGTIVGASAIKRDITQKKQAEQELRRSQQHLQYLLVSSPAVIYSAKPEGDFEATYVSENVFKVLGYEAREFLEDSGFWLNRIHPEDMESLVAGLSQLSQQEMYSHEYRFLHDDGTYHWVCDQINMVRDETGKPIEVVGYLVDISDRKQAESEVTRNKDLKEAIFNESTDALFLVDPETLLTFDCNHRAVELFEAKSKDELIGISGHTLQRQKFPCEELAAIAQEIDTSGGWNRELEYVTKTGKLFWGNLAAKRITVGGKAINLVRVSDISDRKQAEKELELQAVITRNMAEGICLVRVTDALIVYANPKFERMFGYEQGELNGKHVSIVNYADEFMSAEDVNQSIRRAVLQHGEATYEVHNVKKDGTPFWCRATTSIFDHPGYGTVLVAVHQDITEHKQAEDLIKASLREKEVLLKEIHHRVKNNLQIVSSLLQMQSRRTTDQNAALILRDSQNRIASIALVHEKLYRSEDLANIDFAQYIPDLTTHLFDTYNVSSQTVNLTINVDEIFLEIDTAIPCGLIINELVSNCLKYAFPENRKGEIQVEFHTNRDDTLRLLVRDNGIGIPEDLDIETTNSLGLTLIQGLVEQLEGTLELERSQGTCFKITFPGGRR